MVSVTVLVIVKVVPPPDVVIPVPPTTSIAATPEVSCAYPLSPVSLTAVISPVLLVHPKSLLNADKGTLPIASLKAPPVSLNNISELGAGVPS